MPNKYEPGINETSNAEAAPEKRREIDSVADGENVIMGEYRRGLEITRGRLYIIWDIAVSDVKKIMQSRLLMLFMIFAWIVGMVTLILFTYVRQEIPGLGDVYDPMDHMTFYGQTQFFIFFFTGLAGGRLISTNLADGTFILYYLRPIKKYDYLMAKMLALGIIISLVTIIPNTIMFIIQMGIVEADLAWKLGKLWVVGAIWLHGFLMVFTFSGVALCFSSMTRKAVWAYLGVYITLGMTMGLAEIAYELTENKYMFLMSIWRNLENVGNFMFGTPADDLLIHPMVSLAGLMAINLVLWGMLVYTTILRVDRKV